MSLFGSSVVWQSSYRAPLRSLACDFASLRLKVMLARHCGRSGDSHRVFYEGEAEKAARNLERCFQGTVRTWSWVCVLVSSAWLGGLRGVVSGGGRGEATLPIKGRKGNRY